MQFELMHKDMRAVAESHGGELVSLRDRSGTEYIWSGSAPFWSGRNPVLFPIVGRLKNGTVTYDGQTGEMAQHGFARKSGFAVLEQTADSILFELRESEETLKQYPFPFSLQVRHTLNENGFSTEFRVENTGTAPMPFCIGAHTAVCCPIHEGERFEDYEIVFDEKETASMLLLNENNLISHKDREPLLENQDRFTLDYSVFERLDTIILEGLHSTGVSLLHRETGRGVRMEFSGFPMIAFWTQGAMKAPFICLEPWHGCAAVDNEDGSFAGKRHCITLFPGESRTLKYTLSLR